MLLLVRVFVTVTEIKPEHPVYSHFVKNSLELVTGVMLMEDVLWLSCCFQVMCVVNLTV